MTMIILNKHIKIANNTLLYQMELFHCNIKNIIIFIIIIILLYKDIKKIIIK
jgi:hypothetical protein